MILLRGEGKRKKKNVQPSGSSPLPPVLRQKRELCNRGNWKLSHEAVCTEKIEIPSYNLRLYLRFSTSLLLNIYFCVSYIYLLWFHRSSRASSLSLSLSEYEKYEIPRLFSNISRSKNFQLQNSGDIKIKMEGWYRLLQRVHNSLPPAKTTLEVLEIIITNAFFHYLFQNGIKPRRVVVIIVQT